MRNRLSGKINNYFQHFNMYSYFFFSNVLLSALIKRHEKQLLVTHFIAELLVTSSGAMLAVPLRQQLQHPRHKTCELSRRYTPLN